MKRRTQYEKVEKRLACIRLLRALKRYMRYRELERITDLSTATLSRYVIGELIPHQKRADELLAMAERKIHNYVPFDPKTDDINLLSIYADLAFKKLMGLRITKVLTSEYDNIPFASLVAERVSKPIVIASSKLRAMENICVPIKFASDRHEPLFVPKKAIKKSDSVLIVNDLTHVRIALIQICEKAGASITGVLWIDEGGVRFIKFEEVEG